MTIGRLHSIETFGAVDGPGIRTIFFLQGCPARCLYCHNPDTWKPSGGREITINEVLDTAKRSVPYYGKEGGVTFSGGEPMMQGEFVLEAMRTLKKNNIKTVIDTSATYIDEYTEDIIDEAQMLLLDIKHSDYEKFAEIAGCPQDKLLEMIDKRLDKGTRRVTLHLPYDKGGLLDMLYREAKVESVEYSATIDVVAVCGPRTLGQVQPYLET